MRIDLAATESRELIMRTLRIAPFLVLMTVSCATSTAPVAQPPLFTFQSNLWVNLHHFLRGVSRGEPATGNLTAEERAIWNRAVAVYAAKYRNRDLLRDEGMVAIKDSLRGVRGEGPLPDIPSEPELKAVLEAAAPVYRKYWWPAHDTLHRSWIAAARPLVERYGERLSLEVPATYGAQWPSSPHPVDLAVNAGPVGAYSSWPPHTTLTSSDRSYHGLAALEMLFHEASHQWGKSLYTTIATAAESRKKEVPPQLWHAVLFYNSGELTRRALKDDGIGWYREYSGPELYKDLCGDGCRELVAKHWAPRLDGKVSMETALENLVADWPPAK